MSKIISLADKRKQKQDNDKSAEQRKKAFSEIGRLEAELDYRTNKLLTEADELKHRVAEAEQTLSTLVSIIIKMEKELRQRKEHPSFSGNLIISE